MEIKGRNTLVNSGGTRTRDHSLAKNCYTLLTTEFKQSKYINLILLKIIVYKSIDDNIVITSNSNLKGLLRKTSKFIKKEGTSPKASNYSKVNLNF